MACCLGSRDVDHSIIGRDRPRWPPWHSSHSSFAEELVSANVADISNALVDFSIRCFFGLIAKYDICKLFLLFQSCQRGTIEAFGGEGLQKRMVMLLSNPSTQIEWCLKF